MRRKMSIRGKLILVTWSLAFATAIVLTVVFHQRTRRQLLQQLEKTLETKCDEVLTVLEGDAPLPTLEDFLVIETNYRFSPYQYFYQITGEDGWAVARSDNLGRAVLPAPTAWQGGPGGSEVALCTEPHPLAPDEHRFLRIRSERVGVRVAGSEPALFTIQTAVLLDPLEAASRHYLGNAILYATVGLGALFLLLWFVTTRCLRPVSALTRKASRITATNLRERLPLAGTGDELDELATVLNDMLDRLERSLHQMEQFTSDAAHQLRTPLTRIRGELDLILRGELADPLRSQIEKIQDEQERLSRLCGRLLLLARLDQQSEAATLFTDRVPLDGVVSELLDQMAPLAHEKGVRLRRGAQAPVEIRGSRLLLVEALLNLLHNAIRFTPQGGLVEVSIDSKNGQATLSVEDSGPGIPPGERERIFQRFYKGSRSPADPDEGVGLGLAIVKGIAQAHRGRVEVDRARTGGSAFRLILPTT